ncbi:MAG: hypothetical protein M0Z27_08045, partial [Thermaerobacter sp.]|nr:hypothetical protein [Thermaerobacter sp.]
ASTFPGITSEGSVALPGQTPLPGTAGNLPLALVEVMVAVAFLLVFWLQKALRQHVFTAAKLHDPLAVARNTVGEVAAAGLGVAATVYPAARALKVGAALAGKAGHTGARAAGHVTGKPLTGEQRLEQLADDGLMAQLRHDQLVAERTGRKSELLLEAEVRQAERLGPFGQERIRAMRESIRRTARAENLSYEDAARMMGLLREKRRETVEELRQRGDVVGGVGGRQAVPGGKRQRRSRVDAGGEPATWHVEPDGTVHAPPGPSGGAGVAGTPGSGLWVAGPGGTVFRKFAPPGERQRVVRSVRGPAARDADEHWEERVAGMRAQEERTAQRGGAGNVIRPPERPAPEARDRRLWQKTGFARTGTGRVWRRAARLAQRVGGSGSGTPEDLLRRVSERKGADGGGKEG